MSATEVAAFEKNEFYQDAVVLRRWDDLAKDPNLVSPIIEIFTNAIESSLK
jgi:predicted HD phosphohydrolase